ATGAAHRGSPRSCKGVCIGRPAYECLLGLERAPRPVRSAIHRDTRRAYAVAVDIDQCSHGYQGEVIGRPVAHLAIGLATRGRRRARHSAEEVAAFANRLRLWSRAWHSMEIGKLDPPAPAVGRLCL